MITPSTTSSLIPDGFFEIYSDALKNFVNKLGEHGITVELLLADYSWSRANKHADAVALVEDAISFIDSMDSSVISTGHCVPVRSSLTSAPTSAPTPVTSAAPSPDDTSGPSVATTLYPSLSSQVSWCSNNYSPELDFQGKDCYTVTNKVIKNNCNRNQLWIDEKYCQLRCHQAGLGYGNDKCTDICSDEEPPFMKKVKCADYSALEAKCNKKKIWIQNHYCKLSCQNAGVGYAYVDCINGNTSF